eukprot:scaffold20620_cov74-Phaeocystis_antarctica.AAC.12
MSACHDPACICVLFVVWSKVVSCTRSTLDRHNLARPAPHTARRHALSRTGAPAASRTPARARARARLVGPAPGSAGPPSGAGATPGL